MQEKVTICPVCGNEQLDWDYRFCPICGIEVNEKAPDVLPDKMGARGNNQL